jgi:outer membrane protein assembly factor BamB
MRIALIAFFLNRIMAGLLVMLVGSSAWAGEWKHEEVRRFATEEARQGVAVDGEFFYVIDNRKLGKYRKDSGERVAGWEGAKDGPIQHLNAGVVIEGRLYAAHSNFPKVPMESSVEIWDVATMKKVASHPIEDAPGSLTWVQRHGGHWYACFAHYAAGDGPGPEATQLVRYDAQWQPQQTWTFPKELVAKFGKYSASCGAFGPGGKLFVTGHDLKELYVLELPSSGSVLTWLDTVAISAEGQAFAWDPGDEGTLYSISRRTREVIVSKVTSVVNARK